MTLNSVTLTSPVFWASLVASLVLHESAHLAMAYLTGVRVKHIGLSWKGPYIVRESGTPIQNTFISLAGPGINLALCLLFWHGACCFSPWVKFGGVDGTFFFFFR